MQVLPFLLRRLKEDVLADLPPKIIQDYYCDLSDVQMQLYRKFAERQAAAVSSTISGNTAAPAQAAGTHVFQALKYLQLVCNHPALVLTPTNPETVAVERMLAKHGSHLYDLKHATKLAALVQLLHDCGIGAAAGKDITEATVNSHRVLLFAQHKNMLDLVERDVLKGHMPSVTYLRMDGSTPQGRRHQLVTTFNDDPSIDIFLLTTHVGGLGLNLTGADTVIFLEHDWNPMKDLQASRLSASFPPSIVSKTTPNDRVTLMCASRAASAGTTRATHIHPHHKLNCTTAGNMTHHGFLATCCTQLSDNRCCCLVFIALALAASRTYAGHHVCCVHDVRLCNSAGHGPRASHRAEEGCQRVPPHYQGDPGGEDHGPPEVQDQHRKHRRQSGVYMFARVEGACRTAGLLGCIFWLAISTAAASLGVMASLAVMFG